MAAISNIDSGLPDGEPTRLWYTPAFALSLLWFLVVFFNWPYLTSGFVGDDIMFLNILRQDSLPFSRWQGIWSIPVSDWDFLERLWWRDWSAAGGGGFFWRPVPSLIFEGSIRIFGENALPLHVCSILIHGGVTTGLYILMRSLSNHHWLAFFSALFFVTCEDHTMQVGWIAAMTGVLCVFFIIAALVAHTVWLERRKRKWLITSSVSLILAISCKETAAVAPLAIILLCVFFPSGSGDRTGIETGFRERFLTCARDPLSWLPATVILAAYLALYKMLNLGNMSSLVYISPLTEPLKYISHLAVNLPVMWLAAFSPMPPYLAMFWPEMAPVMAVLGAVVFTVFISTLWPLRNKSLLQFAVVLFLLALLPEMATDASERGLYFPMIPASILLAILMLSIKPLATKFAGRLSFTNPPWMRFVGWVVFIGILIPGTVLSVAYPWIYLPGMEKPLKELRTAVPHIQASQAEHIVVLNTSGFMNTIYVSDVLTFVFGDRLDVWLLSSANGIFQLEKTGDSSFVICTDRSGWLDNWFSRLVRTKSNLVQGNRYETSLFTATLDELTSTGRDILAVRFDFNSSLHHHKWLFLRWNGETYEALDVGSLAIGETVKLADTSDIWKSMM
jgi:hypothetical protein